MKRTGAAIRDTRPALQCTEFHHRLVEVAGIILINEFQRFFQNGRFPLLSIDRIGNAEIPGKEPEDISVDDRIR